MARGGPRAGARRARGSRHRHPARPGSRGRARVPGRRAARARPRDRGRRGAPPEGGRHRRLPVVGRGRRGGRTAPRTWTRRARSSRPPRATARGSSTPARPASSASATARTWTRGRRPPPRARPPRCSSRRRRLVRAAAARGTHGERPPPVRPLRPRPRRDPRAGPDGRPRARPRGRRLDELLSPRRRGRVRARRARARPRRARVLHGSDARAGHAAARWWSGSRRGSGSAADDRADGAGTEPPDPIGEDPGAARGHAPVPVVRGGARCAAAAADLNLDLNLDLDLVVDVDVDVDVSRVVAAGRKRPPPDHAKAKTKNDSIRAAAHRPRPAPRARSRTRAACPPARPSKHRRPQSRSGVSAKRGTRCRWKCRSTSPIASAYTCSAPSAARWAAITRAASGPSAASSSGARSYQARAWRSLVSTSQPRSGDGTGEHVEREAGVAQQDPAGKRAGAAHDVAGETRVGRLKCLRGAASRRERADSYRASTLGQRTIPGGRRCARTVRKPAVLPGVLAGGGDGPSRGPFPIVITRSTFSRPFRQPWRRERNGSARARTSGEANLNVGARRHDAAPADPPPPPAPFRGGRLRPPEPLLPPLRRLPRRRGEARLGQLELREVPAVPRPRRAARRSPTRTRTSGGTGRSTERSVSR